MKMNCCLWLNGEKVRRAEDIKNNFDIAALRGYFLGGSLKRWLEANGGIEEARKLEDLNCTEDINAGLEYAFGLRGKPPSRTVVEKKTQESYKIYNKNIFGGFNENLFGNYRNGYTNSSRVVVGNGFNSSGKAAFGSGFNTSRGVVFGSWFNSSSWSASGSGFGLSGWSSFGSWFNLSGWSSFGSWLNSSGFAVLSGERYSENLNIYGSIFLGSGALSGSGFTKKGGSFLVGSFDEESNFSEIKEFEESEKQSNKNMLETWLLCKLNRYGYGIHII